MGGMTARIHTKAKKKYKWEAITEKYRRRLYNIECLSMNETRMTVEKTHHQEYTFSRVITNSRTEVYKQYTRAWG